MADSILADTKTLYLVTEQIASTTSNVYFYVVTDSTPKTNTGSGMCYRQN
jgi:hypothetical protein